MDITSSLSHCGIHSSGGSHVHHRFLGTADKIINNFANLHLRENPGSSTNHSTPIPPCKEDYSECCGFEALPWLDGIEEDHSPDLWEELAGVALEKYRERQGVKFELVGEVDASVMWMATASCFHLYFQAKSNGDSPVQFFAEVFRAEGGGVHVSFCDIMDPSNPNLLKGCQDCCSYVLHPNGVKFCKVPPPEAFVRGAASN